MKWLKLKKKSSVCLVYRPETATATAVGASLAQFLSKLGHSVYTGPDQAKIDGTLAMKSAKDFQKISLVVVLGGDGTYLRAVRILEGRNIPILGVHLGSLGFLTPVKTDDLFSAIQAVLDGKMQLQPRTMLSVKLVRQRKTICTCMSLNDVVIERGPFSQLINTAIFHNKKLVSEVKADGLIVSTPTGSTAYNLAAGGPIMHPETPALVVTSVAPHSLTSRPLIFPDQMELSFRLASKSVLHNRHAAHLVVDGVKIEDIYPEDEIVIKKSAIKHLMIREPDHNYFQLLREKLKFGDRS